MQNGKGSSRRPKSVSQETWDRNWEAIFRPKKEKIINRPEANDSKNNSSNRSH